jgi:hypothetical protein
MKLIKSIWKNWCHDIVHNPMLFWVEIGSTFMNMTASVLMGFMSTNPPLITIFSLWIIGSVGMAWASFKRDAAWMLVLMAFYTVMNIVGFLGLVL